jgi:FKBP-type peptidyl-prolyl cis-trans isomerase 2
VTNEEVIERFGLQVGRRMPVEIPEKRRDDLAIWLGQWGLHRGVEVGTYEGEYAEVLLKANPELNLTCVDPWKVYGGYKDYRRQKTLDRAFDAAQGRLVFFGDRVQINRTTSLEAAAQIEDGSLDFVYIDANHLLPYAIADIHAWHPKVKTGGIVSGHDYVKRSRWPHVHVVEATHAYTSAYGIHPWFVVGRRRGDDFCRSWFWVKS